MNGTLRTGAELRFMQARPPTTPTRSASAAPTTTPVAELGPGEVGYLIAGIKDVGEARSGETVTDAVRAGVRPLEGYREPKPMVFCGLYPVDGDEFADLREALEKLRLNDSSFTYEPETLGRARLRLPLRLPRPAAHGDRPRAPRARVRPRPHRHRARRSSTSVHTHRRARC